MASDICANLDTDRCQERLVAQSVCLQTPDEKGCAELRTSGFLPPLAPPLYSVLRCWQVDEPRDDVPRSWICLGRDTFAMGPRWNVWSHTGWHRQDTADRAGWETELADGRTIWLAVMHAAPHAKASALHISDASGLSAGLISGDSSLAAEITDRVAALPTIGEVCGAARACIAGLPRRQSSNLEEAELSPDPDPVAGRSTLRTCYDAWLTAAGHLIEAGTAVPAGCGTVERTESWGIDASVHPPFAPIDHAER